MKKKIIGLLALALVAAGALGYTGYAYAQAEDAQWSDFVSGTYVPASFSEDGKDGTRPDKAVLREYITAAIADAFGLTPEELVAKKEAGENLADIAAAAGIAKEDLPAVMKAAFETAVNNALADGVITEEQAARILENAGKDGRPGDRPGHDDRPEGKRLEIFIDVNESVLGLTREEIKTRTEAGETFEDLLTAQGFTKESYAEAVKTEMIARINQAVADGTMEQEEADQMIERIENAEGFPGRPGDRPGHGGKGGPGGQPGHDENGSGNRPSHDDQNQNAPAADDTNG